MVMLHNYFYFYLLKGTQSFIHSFITNYLYSPRRTKNASTKPTFIASSTSPKIIIASLLSRWGNDALTKYVEEFIINSWAEKIRKQ